MGKEVLVPVFVRAYIKDEGNFGTDEEARQAAIKAVKDAPRKFFQIDNEPCDIYYKETGPFNIKGVPENNILDNPSLQSKQLDYNNAYSAGYWSKVKLPRKGSSYTVKLGGEKDSFKTEVTYRLQCRSFI